MELTYWVYGIQDSISSGGMLRVIWEGLVGVTRSSVIRAFRGVRTCLDVGIIQSSRNDSFGRALSQWASRPVWDKQVWYGGHLGASQVRGW